MSPPAPSPALVALRVAAPLPPPASFTPVDIPSAPLAMDAAASASQEREAAALRLADRGAMERAAEAAQRPAAATSRQSDLPPPPSTVLQMSKPEGGYRELKSPVPDPPVRRRSSGAPAPLPRGEDAAPPAAGNNPPSGRYSVSRPASAFATSRPPEGRSIFGEDLISEKSLDEVILSYLAEDLEAAPSKK